MRYYHREVYMPEVNYPTTFALDYSEHAKDEAGKDRYGNLTMLLPFVLNFTPADVVEVGLEDGSQAVGHLLVRVNVNKTTDLVFALAPGRNGRAKVKTVWANMANDAHRTLNTTRYEKRPR